MRLGHRNCDPDGQGYIYDARPVCPRLDMGIDEAFETQQQVLCPVQITTLKQHTKRFGHKNIYSVNDFTTDQRPRGNVNKPLEVLAGRLDVEFRWEC